MKFLLFLNHGPNFNSFNSQNLMMPSFDTQNGYLDLPYSQFNLTTAHAIGTCGHRLKHAGHR